MSALSLSTFRRSGDLFVSALGALDATTAAVGSQPKVPR